MEPLAFLAAELKAGVLPMGMANKIRVLLIERNMKIKDLAEQLGYSGNNLSGKEI